MKYVAAYLLTQLGGNESPSVNDIKKILSSVGIESDVARLEAFLGEVSGKTVDDSGSSKLASMPAGAAPVAAPTAPAAATTASAAGDKKEKAPPKKEESEEEEMGFGLFD